MLFLVNNENLETVVGALSTCQNPDAVVKMALGTAEMGDDVVCIAKCIGGTEEIAVKFVAKKPADFEAGKVTSVAFNAQYLISTLTALLALKEQIFIDVNDVVKIGVKDKSIIQVPVLGEDAIPTQIQLDKNNQIVCAFVKQNDFITLLKAGFATASSDASGRGTDNATVVVKDNSLALYSCNSNGTVMGTAEVTCDIKDVPTEGDSSKRKDYCKEKNLSDLIVAIPKKVVLNLLKLVGGDAKCSVMFTDKHLVVAPSNSVTYVATLGANAFAGGVKMTAMVDAQEIAGAVVFDSDKLKTALGIIQNMVALAKEKNKPIELKFGKEKVMLSQSNGQSRMIVDLVSSSMTDTATRYLDAERLSQILGVLQKGNVKLTLRANEQMPLCLTNGGLDADGVSKAYLMTAVKQEDAEVESTEATEEK